MTEKDRFDAIFDNTKSLPSDRIDKRPWWVRLLASIKFDLKLGNSIKKPIKSVMIKGKIDF
jgi:hypothetical protein